MMNVVGSYYPGGDTHWVPSSTFTPDGQILVANEDGFAINNPNPTSSQGAGNYSIHLYSVDGTFQYDTTNPDRPVPVEGDIAYVQVEDDATNVYFELDPAEGGSFNDFSIADFWFNLQNYGAKAALDNLVGSGFSLTGFSDADHAETYGTNGYFDLGAGDDTLAISYSFTTAYGGEGNDTFTITEGGLLGLSLHGGSPTGDGVGSDFNIVNFAAAGTLSFDALDDIQEFIFSAPSGGQFIYLTTDQIPGGSSASFMVQGSNNGAANEIVIERSGPSPVALNFSHVVTSGFSRYNQAFVFDFSGDTHGQNDVVVGVKNARNIFEFGNGNDHAVGGNLGDIFYGGGGNNIFNGGGGIDVAGFSGARGRYTIVETAPHRFVVHDNRPHSPDGTDVLVNVEYLSFANGYVWIGGPHPAAEAAATHMAGLDFHLHA
jgi:Ca2+-binding RTX toxin-like protein